MWSGRSRFLRLHSGWRWRCFKQILTRFPSPKPGFFELFAYMLLSIESIIFGFVIYCLFEAVRASAYIYPPTEPDILEWAHELVASDVREGKSQSDAETTAEAIVRQFYVSALAEATQHNRTQNVRKAMARTRGLTALVVLLGLAFVLAAAIFTQRQTAGHARKGDHENPSERLDERKNS